MTSQLKVVEETAVPSGNDHLTLSHWQLPHMPWLEFKPGQCESQLAVCGNALDHSAIRVGPNDKDDDDDNGDDYDEKSNDDDEENVYVESDDLMRMRLIHKMHVSEWVKNLYHLIESCLATDMFQYLKVQFLGPYFGIPK